MNKYKNYPSKVGYFSKIQEIFTTALTAQTVQKGQKVKLTFSNVAYRPTVYKTGAIVPIAILFVARPYIFSRYI